MMRKKSDGHTNSEIIAEKWFARQGRIRFMDFPNSELIEYL